MHAFEFSYLQIGEVGIDRNPARIPLHIDFKTLTRSMLSLLGIAKIYIPCVFVRHCMGTEETLMRRTVISIQR